MTPRIQVGIPHVQLSVFIARQDRTGNISYGVSSCAFDPSVRVVVVRFNARAPGPFAILDDVDGLYEQRLKGLIAGRRIRHVDGRTNQDSFVVRRNH